MSGDVAWDLQLPTDDGPLNVRALATAPSVSGLRSAELPGARFVPAGAGDGVGDAQRWRLELTNPFRAPVWIGRTMLSGRDARRFRISANHCAQSTLRPHGGCRLVVVFTPTRPGPAAGQLTLQGTGSPLIVPLRPMAFALPAVRRLTISERDGCAAAPGAWVSATVSQSAAVHWTLRRLAGAGRAGCPRPGALAGRTVASGTVRTGHRARTHLAHWPMPAGLFVAAPSDYVLTAFAVNEHGAGPARVIVVRLGA